MLDYTKDELLSLIEKDPEKFNEWKLTNSEEIDLSEVDFSNMVLKEVDFSGADLNSSSFADSDLSLVNFTDTDLTSVDFTRASVVECDFTDSLLPGADCSYAQMTFCNFAGCDMAGCILSETDLSNSDLSSAENLSAARFDSDTVWPDNDMLPEDFDAEISDDLSALKDEDDAPIRSDGEY